MAELSLWHAKSFALGNHIPLWISQNIWPSSRLNIWAIHFYLDKQIGFFSPFVGFLRRTNSYLNFFLFLFQGRRVTGIGCLPLSPPPPPWLVGRSFFTLYLNCVCVCVCVCGAKRPVVVEEVNLTLPISSAYSTITQEKAWQVLWQESLSWHWVDFRNESVCWCQVTSCWRRPPCSLPFCPNQWAITLALRPSRDVVQSGADWGCHSFLEQQQEPEPCPVGILPCSMNAWGAQKAPEPKAVSPLL